MEGTKKQALVYFNRINVKIAEKTGYGRVNVFIDHPPPLMPDGDGIRISNDADNRLLKDQLPEIDPFSAIYLPEMDPVDGYGVERQFVKGTGGISPFLQQIVPDSIGNQFNAVDGDLACEDIQVQFFEIGTVNTVTCIQNLILKIIPQQLFAIVIECGEKRDETSDQQQEKYNQDVPQPVGFTLYGNLIIFRIHFCHAIPL
jgi:hypothetical protein